LRDVSMLRWDLLTGGTINFHRMVRSFTHYFSYCGDRYFRPSDRDTDNVISFTIGTPHLQPNSLDQSEKSKRSKEEAHLDHPLQGVIYSVTPFAPLIMLSIVSIASLFPSLGGLYSRKV
jgi:hypothetical protein